MFFNQENLNTEQFLRDYWQRKPLVMRRALTGLPGILSADELAGLACEESVESRLKNRKSDHDPVAWPVLRPSHVNS